MAKVKINKLPEGFQLNNGKLESMKSGGSTGDQVDYGLQTFVPDYSGSASSEGLRYSLSSVPRDKANVEAEGGETVLTDLEQDGRFGLYNIQGSRHSSGGVPMYLPENSFIFSDTRSMKMKPNKLAEFGIETRKGMTPAEVSKKFQLNEYYGAMDDQFADTIQARSAEMMMEKNGLDLSKLAFSQEMDKSFPDGLPSVAHPYLNSIGIDPMEFATKALEISEEKAMEDFMASLTPEQREQMMMMEQLKAQQAQLAQGQQGSPQGMPPEMMQQQMPPEMMQQGVSPDMMQQGMSPDMMGAMMPSDIPMAQNGRFINNIKNLFNRGSKENFDPKQDVLIKQAGKLNQFFNKPTGVKRERGFPQPWEPNVEKERGEMDSLYFQDGGTVTVNNKVYTYEEFRNGMKNGTILEQILNDKQLNINVEGPTNTNEEIELNKEINGLKDMIIQTIEDNPFATQDWPDGNRIENNPLDDNLNLQFDPENIPVLDTNNTNNNQNDSDDPVAVLDMPEENEEEDVPPPPTNNNTEEDGTKGPNEKRNDDIYLRNQDQNIWEDGDDIDRIQKKIDGYENLYLNDEEIIKQLQEDPNFKDVWYDNIDQRIVKDMDLKSIDELISSPEKTLEYQKKWNEYHPDNKIKEDGKIGKQTIRTTVKTDDPPPVVKDCPKCPEGFTRKPTAADPCNCEEITTPDIPGISTYQQPDPEFWTQDLNLLGNIAMRNRRLGTPWQPDVSPIRMDYVLKDPTRAIAALNEQLAANNLGVSGYSGPQAASARMSELAGKNATAIANVVSQYNADNVKTINDANYKNAVFEKATELEERNRKVKEYDDYERSLEKYNNEKMFDRDQYTLAMNNALTNRANTYNMNSINDIYQIDPSSQGMIYYNQGRGPLDLNRNRANKSPNMDYYERMQDIQKHYPDAKTTDIIKMYDQLYGTSNSSGGGGGLPGGYPGSPGLARRGKAIKKPIVPFYTGKIGI